VGHPPRIPVWLGYDQAVVYFVTFCVKDRRSVLANDEAFVAFTEVAQLIGNWTMIAAVLMPDHVHLLAAPNERGYAGGFFYRPQSSEQCEDVCGRPGNGKRDVLIDCFVPTNQRTINGIT